jgi:hypothetical protein
MGIDHGGGDILVAQKGLNGTDVRTPLQKMGGEAMPECVGADMFLNAGPTYGIGNGFINGTWIEMMPPHGAAPGISGKVLGGKYILPSPILCCTGVLPGQGMGHVDPPHARL